ncbi:MAG: chromosome segregation protein SMC [Candidatus Omnitrophica bacterium]|nr:chromosome segregation protein SMC [Candidatus Omnitrophota bacterium]
MYLKKLEIFGFKSFAAKTEVVFEKGITCIVGPNGCGKSNVSDAIRWVLGERSARTLRGSSMEDIIFNGTDFRKPLSLAEVSLVIDNSTRLFPLEYDEVVLSRRIYRSGETEYFINKTPCRLKDIRELTMDTGMGSNTYSMIGQGQIDYILNADPEERRSLIEEAAGIAKYRSKKEEALRKLERTENNLLRLNDIITEVDKNIKYAERQARRAEKYKGQFEELKRLEIVRSFRDLDKIREGKEGIEKEKQSLSEEELTLGQLLESISSELQKLEGELLNVEREVSLIDEKRYQRQSALTSIEERSKYIKDALAEIEKSDTENADEIDRSRERLAAIGEELERREGEASQFSLDSKDIFVKHQNLEKEVFALSNEVREREEGLLVMKQSAFDEARGLADSHNELNKINIDIATLTNKTERLLKAIGKLKCEKERHGEEISATESDLGSLKSEIASEAMSLGSLKDGYSRSEQSIRQIQDELIKLRSGKEAASSKIRFLSAWQTQGNVSILGADSPFHGVVHSLMSHLEVKAEFKEAIQSALYEHIHDVVVDNWGLALDIARFLKEKTGAEHDLGILVNTPSSIREEKPLPDSPLKDFVLGKAGEFVTAEHSFSTLAQELLKNTYIVKDFPREIAAILANTPLEHRFVSTDGTVLGPGNSMRYRNIKSGELAQGEAMDSLSSLTKELAEYEGKENNLEGELSRQSEKHAELEAALGCREKGLNEKRVNYESKSHILGNLKTQSDKISQELVVFELELKEAQAETDDLKKREKEISEKRSILEKKDYQAKESLEYESKQLDEKKKTKETLSLEWTKIDTEIKHLREKERHYRETIALFQKEAKEVESRITRCEEGIRENGIRKGSLTQEEAEIVLKKEALKTELGDLDCGSIGIRKSRETLSNSKNGLTERLNQSRETQSTLKEKQHKIQIKSMELDYQSSSIHERVLQTYKIDLNQLDKAAFALSGEKTNEEFEVEINELKKKVESLGTVNLLAIEEYEELKKRFEFLDKQRNDLVQARESLLEAIRKINRTTRSLFVETFGQVQNCFREYYRTLFGGGHAELILLDESQPLESGIDVVARPPGKKLQNISLLSGGEKALTAVALLFALFKIKPSPFCLLDEVDAPLDEANIDRFLTIVRQFTESTQFIIITHNRKTIAMGDCLYGITMEEAGISKVVSVKVGDAARKASIQQDLMSEKSAEITAK